MSNFFKLINKYIILLIFISFFGMPWLYVKILLIKNNISTIDILNNIPIAFSYLILLIIIVLIIIDSKKHKIKNTVLVCIATLFYPLLGVLLFAILFIDKKSKA